MSEEQKPKSFEVLLTELERVVHNLERGDLSLEDALAAFEHGTTVAKDATALLDSAEERVKKLIETRDGMKEVPLSGHPG